LSSLARFSLVPLRHSALDAGHAPP